MCCSIALVTYRLVVPLHLYWPCVLPMQTCTRHLSLGRCHAVRFTRTSLFHAKVTWYKTKTNQTVTGRRRSKTETQIVRPYAPADVWMHASNNRTSRITTFRRFPMLTSDIICPPPLPTQGVQNICIAVLHEM